MAFITVTKDTFENEVLKSDKPVLADFNADWCGPCQMLKPILEELSESYEGYKFVSINIDDEDELAEEYDVASIPCLVIFKDGAETERSIGMKPREALEELLEGN
ncbi:MAG: thioredoxin [Oscillospiraceae bacterium]|nr:thioredoxin [Oscillospiraceae bacterium]